MSARRYPVLVSLKLDAKFVVEDPQVAIPSSGDGFRRNRLNLLSHHANICPVTPVIAEAIKTDAIGEIAEKDDVVFERDI